MFCCSPLPLLLARPFSCTFCLVSLVVFSSEDRRATSQIEQSSFSWSDTDLTNHISVINYSLFVLMPHYVTGSAVNTGSNLEVDKDRVQRLGGLISDQYVAKQG